VSKNDTWADKLPTDKRVEKAKKVADKLIDLTVNVIKIHESNRLLILIKLRNKFLVHLPFTHLN
jgi:hypothetical protein